MRDRADGDAVEHFLEDGVAPPVIGGGPPESPFDAPSDTGPDPGHGPRHAPFGAEPDHRVEPPTSPIPVARRLPPEQEQQKRRSWVARVFRLPEK